MNLKDDDTVSAVALVAESDDADAVDGPDAPDAPDTPEPTPGEAPTPDGGEDSEHSPDPASNGSATSGE